MLLLRNISLLQFKNYKQSEFRFDRRLVGICGRNGVGKTNLLDAIYYLCFTRSYFTKSDALNQSQGSAGFRIEAAFSLGNQHEAVLCILRENGKKEFLRNGEGYEKFSDYVGKFPCVMVAPDDLHMITGGSEERRRFLDTLLCQLDPNYLKCLIKYNRTLQQKNSHLRALAEKRQDDNQLLDVYDSQLMESGNSIFQKRKEFTSGLIESIKKFYFEIAGRPEALELDYESQLLERGFDQLLKDSRERDLITQRSTAGIQRDEIEIKLMDQSFRAIASQGQRKSLLFAMKMAEFEILKKEKGFAPILLLDDVFEKLDEGRMSNLLNWACIRNEGQVFITDTHCQRIIREFQELGVEGQQIHL